MYHIVYRTTNLLNGKYYIGKHSSKKIVDGYLGSGNRLISAVKKYGKENFMRENLFIFETEEESLLKENELISLLDIPNDKDCYNLCPVGNGRKQFGVCFSDEMKDRISRNPNHGMKGKTHSTEARQKISEAHKGRPSIRKGIKVSEITRKKMSLSSKGKPKSEEHKKNISKSGSGILHSGFGHIWITDEIKNLRIVSNDTIPNGWKKGRTLKEYKKRVRS